MERTLDYTGCRQCLHRMPPGDVYHCLRHMELLRAASHSEASSETAHNFVSPGDGGTVCAGDGVAAGGRPAGAGRPCGQRADAAEPRCGRAALGDRQAHACHVRLTLILRKPDSACARRRRAAPWCRPAAAARRQRQSSACAPCSPREEPRSRCRPAAGGTAAATSTRAPSRGQIAEPVGQQLGQRRVLRLCIQERLLCSVRSTGGRIGRPRQNRRLPGSRVSAAGEAAAAIEYKQQCASNRVCVLCWFL